MGWKMLLHGSETLMALSLKPRERYMEHAQFPFGYE